MKIRNTIIITDADSELSMTIAEQSDFTGNVIFARDKLPPYLAIALDYATGHSTKVNAAVPNHSGASVKSELVR